MPVYKPGKSPFYHYDFQFKGRRFHGSTGCRSKTEARRVEAEKRREAALPKAPDAITLDDALGGYLAARIKGKTSEDTVKGHMGKLIAHFGRGRLLSDIGRADLHHFTMRQRASVSDTTVNRIMEVARATWRFAATTLERDTGKPIDWKALRMKEPEPPKRELSEDEEDRLFREIRWDLRAYVLFCLWTGRRLKEARTLRWEDISEMQYRVTVKGGKVQTFPLTPRVAALIQTQPEAGPYVFTYVCQRSTKTRRAGKRYPITQQGWKREWARALKAAGIAGFRFHDLRHTFGTRLLRATGDLALVKEAMGHADIQTTTRYAHVLTDDVRAGMLAMERAEKPRIEEVKDEER